MNATMSSSPRRPDRAAGDRRRDWVRWWARARVALSRSLFVAVTVVGAVLFWVLMPRPEAEAFWSLSWILPFFAFIVLASLPTWLYVRFLAVKLESVYAEYVLNLFRLGVDDALNLPEPPRFSVYHDEWERRRQTRQVPSEDAAAGGPLEPPQPGDETLYDRKFEAYFGKRPFGDVESSTGRQGVGEGSLLPVFVAWGAFAAGWLSILLDQEFRNLPGYSGPAPLADVLRFAFLGAYVFSVQLTVRAYFQNDLRSSTYVATLERLAVVLVVVSVVHVLWNQVPDSVGLGSVEVAFAFIVGSFPIVGQQVINQVVGQRLQTKLQSLTSRHPLDDIDGMNIWYQARLLEEGIEDVENLATANVVDVVLHSRAPVGRLVDWLDQALLLQHLPPWTAPDRQATGRREATTKADQAKGGTVFGHETDADLHRALFALGIRTASDLLEAFSPLTKDSASRIGHDVRGLWPTSEHTPSDFPAKAVQLVCPPGSAEIIRYRMISVLRCLASEPNLRLVLNWQAGLKDYRPEASRATGRSPGVPLLTPAGE